MSEDRNERLQKHHDTLHMSAWLNQMSAVWGMHQYAALVEVACLSGWYILFLSEKPYSHFLANLLLLLGSMLQYLMIFTIRRQAQILRVFYYELLGSGVFSEEKTKPIGLFGGQNGGLYAHQLARVFLAVLIATNAFLALFTSMHARESLDFPALLIVLVLLGLHLAFLGLLLTVFWTGGRASRILIED